MGLDAISKLQRNSSNNCMFSKAVAIKSIGLAEKSLEKEALAIAMAIIYQFIAYGVNAATMTI